MEGLFTGPVVFLIILSIMLLFGLGLFVYNRGRRG